jgi:ppGpp synthetase/RelA/SpoT-type nucleotidyltranferase
MANDHAVEACIELFKRRRHEFEAWLQAIVSHLRLDPELNKPPLPIIHSIKYRLKEADHLAEKITRKIASATRYIDTDNLFSQVTDLAGVRVLHLHSSQFKFIHQKIQSMVDSGDWRFGEPPVAYSWDPDCKADFERLGLRVEIKDSNYTSIHYLIRPPNEKSQICCEVQVRTLFEEVWGEIDHAVNYPEQTNSLPCKGQLRALSRLVSTGTRLADSIFDTHQEHATKPEK